MNTDDVKKIADQSRAMLRMIPDNKTADEWNLFVVTQAINKALEQERVRNVCIHHNDAQRSAVSKECPVCLKSERDSLQQKLDRITPLKNSDIRLVRDLSVEKIELQQKLEQAEKACAELRDSLACDRFDLNLKIIELENAESKIKTAAIALNAVHHEFAARHRQFESENPDGELRTTIKSALSTLSTEPKPQ